MDVSTTIAIVILSDKRQYSVFELELSCDLQRLFLILFPMLHCSAFTDRQLQLATFFMQRKVDLSRCSVDCRKPTVLASPATTVNHFSITVSLMTTYRASYEASNHRISDAKVSNIESL